MSGYSEWFEKTKAELFEKGYQKKDVTVSSGKAMGIGFLYALPFVVVRFNISAMMPSCACKVPLEKKAYLTGGLTPFIVLGFGSVLFVWIYPGTASLLTMMVSFVSAGADLMIALNVLKERDALIVDHPTEAGYIAFYK